MNGHVCGTGAGNRALAFVYEPFGTGAQASQKPLCYTACVPISMQQGGAMTIAQQLVTADDLLHMPDDGFRYELINGELHQMAPAGFEHGSTAMSVGSSLYQYVRAHQMGTVTTAETGFRLTSDPDTVRAPDAAFIMRERVEAAGDVKGYWPGAPDLVVEVISPNDLYTEVEEKVADWMQAGTRVVIVVNPRRRSVNVYRPGADVRVLTESDTLDGGDVVPGWTLPVREMFA